MNKLVPTSHAAVRMAQRNVALRDAELIAAIGTEVNDGYLVRQKDYQNAERTIKAFLQHIRRLVGKRLVIADGRILTAYRASKKTEQRLVRDAYETDLK